jgi:hypothetical protein
VGHIGDLLNGSHRCGPWALGRTIEIDRGNHVVPLSIQVTPAG